MINRTEFSNNVANIEGGALYLRGIEENNKCIFDGLLLSYNKVTSDVRGAGGAVLTTNPLILSQLCSCPIRVNMERQFTQLSRNLHYECSFIANIAGGSGRMHISNSDVHLTNSKFENNQAGTVGGALRLYGDNSNGVGHIQLDRVTIQNNTALELGGGLHIMYKSIFHARDSSFVNNGIYEIVTYNSSEGTPLMSIINTMFVSNINTTKFYGYESKFIPPKTYPQPVHLQQVHKPHLRQQSQPEQELYVCWMPTRKVWSQRIRLSRLSNRKIWNQSGHNSEVRSLFKLCYWAIQPFHRSNLLLADLSWRKVWKCHRSFFCRRRMPQHMPVGSVRRCNR